MNKALKFILWKMNGATRRIGAYLFKKLIKTNESHNIHITYNGDKCMPLLETFTYIDEASPYIRHIRELFLFKMIGINKKYSDTPCSNNKLIIVDENSFVIDSSARKKTDATDWTCLYTKQELPERFCISFNTIIKSEFTEFQIAFRHRSIADRLRFMVLDNKSLVFEVIRHGIFFGTICSTPFSFELGKEYGIRIVIDGNRYYFMVNEKVILSIIDNSPRGLLLHPRGGMAFILWNNSKRSTDSVKAQISNITFDTIKSLR